MEIWIIILTSSVITALINIAWKIIESKITQKNTRYLQIDNYFRSTSGENMQDIYNKWTELLFRVGEVEVKEKMADVGYINSLIYDTFMYSSSESVRRLAIFQQYSYTEHEKKAKGDIEIIVLVASIIASLKKDFTGNQVNIEDVLRIKMTDINDKEEEVKKVIKKHGFKSLKEFRTTNTKHY
ncbi:hypothetical protein SAMN04488127_0826 [Bhargavaea ginsengi]|uniref:Uncharacterized protein n=2 Tax=Bhargavaea ginsengi TaxID=426757 RepID=A0A1H6UZ78_9BACL|nr:hypothetical protein SAMN04488127_0826 [Bhargavaea ginsengi]